MFDTLKRDIRVLIEHRSGELVKAINSKENLERYLEVFEKLDELQGELLFERRFGKVEGGGENLK